MNNKAQIICGYMGFISIACFFGALVIGGFLPPTDPALSIEDTAAQLLAKTNSVRWTIVFMAIAAAFGMAFFCAISAQMLKMQTQNALTLSMMQLMCGSLTIVPIICGAVLWSVAVYRPERPPEIITTLNDMVWFFLVMPYITVLVQFLSIGFATLSDRSSPSVYPRWYGYFALWFGILAPVCLFTPFFHTGPFTWRGLLSFWLIAILNGFILPAQAMVMIKAAKRLPQE